MFNPQINITCSTRISMGCQRVSPYQKIRDILIGECV